MSCSITYEHVSYTYADGTEALRDVSFMLSHGEHVALLGPNGAGKSTIMLLSNGVLLPQAGNVRVGDTLLGPKTLVEIRRRVGLLFQDPDDQLFMTTLYDDVAFGPLNNPPRNHAPQNHAPLSNAGDRDDRDPVKSLVDDALAAVSLIEFAGKAPQDLSFGQKKRAALACVLAMQPDFLILDEPSSNLDPRGRRQMMELIRGIEGTVLIATHDLDLVWELLGRSIILDGGQVVADGPTRELLRDRELVEAHGLELPAAVRYG
ncbi:MAG: energy-coupling factor ABC transporter ATP-binding protein [Coriobacteriales bacterium]|jgi:cobalt/nickel transport system ATP-binding protein|nr:energy-coupling factor ABC transporter ATP-binding protein [Coriobacteriales bacterium]